MRSTALIEASWLQETSRRSFALYSPDFLGCRLGPAYPSWWQSKQDDIRHFSANFAIMQLSTIAMAGCGWLETEAG